MSFNFWSTCKENIINEKYVLISYNNTVFYIIIYNCIGT